MDSGLACTDLPACPTVVQRTGEGLSVTVASAGLGRTRPIVRRALDRAIVDVANRNRWRVSPRKTIPGDGALPTGP